MATHKITMVVEKTNTGYSAYSETDGVFTTGTTLPDLKKNMVEACNLQFEDQGRVVSEADLNIVLDLPQFFEFYKEINATALSRRIGMNQSLLAQYISGQKKPSSQQVHRILDGVRQVGRELAEMDFA